MKENSGLLFIHLHNSAASALYSRALCPLDDMALEHIVTYYMSEPEENSSVFCL